MCISVDLPSAPDGRHRGHELAGADVEGDAAEGSSTAVLALAETARQVAGADEQKRRSSSLSVNRPRSLQRHRERP